MKNILLIELSELFLITIDFLQVLCLNYIDQSFLEIKLTH